MATKPPSSTMNLIALVVLLVLTGACSPFAEGASTVEGAAETPEGDTTEATTTGETDPSSGGAGEPVEVTFIYSAPSHDPIRNEAGNLISAAWEDLGITVTAEPMDFTALSQRLEGQHDSFDAFISGYVSRPERLDPDVLLYRPFHSSGIENVNYQGYASDRYDEVVEAQRTEIDEDTRIELVQEAQQVLAEELPALALYHVRDIHAYNTEVLTDVVPMMGQGLWNFWTITEASVDAPDGMIRMGQEWDLDATNPFAPTGGGNIEVNRLVYDLLARVDENGEAVPWAAESWEQVDPLTVEVTLREGMTFHDGTPVTANDVAFSYMRQKEDDAALYAPFLEAVESIDVVDDLNLTINLSEPYPGLFLATFAQVIILPEHIWGDVEVLPEFNNDEMIGSGPMLFDEWIVGEEIRLVRNEDHFAPPNAEGLIHVVYANPDAIFAGLEAGDIYMHDRRLLPAAIERAEQVEHLEVVNIDDFGVYYMGFNLRHAPFNDLAFRQAMAHTIDYDTIVNTLLEGYAEPGRGFIAPANEKWHNPDIPFYEFDVDRARTILEEAGYSWDDTGRLLAPDG